MKKYKKYITFSVLIEEELANGKNITHKLNFIGSFRFMWSKLSDLINNLSEIYSKECRGCNEKESNQYGILLELKIMNYTINATNVKKRLTPLSGLVKHFRKTYKFCNNDINKFILSLKKEFTLMNTWIPGKDLMKHHCQIKKLFILI